MYVHICIWGRTRERETAKRKGIERGAHLQPNAQTPSKKKESLSESFAATFFLCCFVLNCSIAYDMDSTVAMKWLGRNREGNKLRAEQHNIPCFPRTFRFLFGFVVFLFIFFRSTSHSIPPKKKKVNFGIEGNATSNTISFCPVPGHGHRRFLKNIE